MHHLTRRALPAVAALTGMALFPAAAQAATRTYIVTDFDTVRVEAPIAVAVETRRGVTARGEGDAALLERIELSVSSRVLTVRLKRSPYETRGGKEGEARLFLTAPALRRAQLTGAGTLAINGMGGQSAEVIAAGSGALSVAGLQGDAVTIWQQGSGTLRLAGSARKTVMQLAGAGTIDARALTSADLEVTAEGAGSLRARATRSAKVVAIGPAEVTIEGRPACTVRHAGSGRVLCGADSF